MPPPADLIAWETTAKQQRETYQARTQLLAEVPIIGRLHLLQAVPGGLRPDAHPDEYELHLIQEGCLDLWVDRPDDSYAVTGGLAILTQPGQVHGGTREVLNPGRWSWLRFVISPGPRGGGGLSGAQAADLRQRLAAVAPPVFSYSPPLENAFDRLLDEHRRPTTTSQLMARSLLHELILWVVRDHTAAGLNATRNRPGFSPPIRAAVDWLDQHIGEPVLVERAAEAAGLSESYFRRWFQKEVGFSPADYLMYQRIEAAKRMLRSDPRLAITDVAMRLGFSTSAYFTAVFRKRVGRTPTDYRAERPPIDPIEIRPGRKPKSAAAARP